MPVTWLLVPCLIYLAAHGSFSFQEVGGHASDNINLVATHTDSDSVTSRIQRTALWPLLFLVAFPLLPRIWRLAKQTRWISLLVGVALISIAWSQFPARTLVFGALLCLTTGFAFYLSVRFDPDQQMKLIMLAGFAVALLSAIVAIFIPFYGVNQGIHEEWKGIFHTKNVCARALIFLLTPVYHIRRQTLSQLSLCIVYFSLLIAVIFMTQSKTGWIIALAYTGYAVFIESYQKFNKLSRSLITVSSIGIACGLIFFFLEKLSKVLGLLGKDSTLTGRVDIWRAVLESGSKHPFLGYGYAGFWNGIQGEVYNIVMKLGWLVPYSHNGFLDVWIQLGLLGLVILLIGMVVACKNSLACLSARPSGYVNWCLGLFVLTVLYNLDEGTLLASNELCWALYVLACAGVATQAAKIGLKDAQAPTLLRVAA